MNHPSLNRVYTGRQPPAVLALQVQCDNPHAPHADLVLIAIDAGIAQRIEAVKARFGWIDGVTLGDVSFNLDGVSASWIPVHWMRTGAGAVGRDPESPGITRRGCVFVQSTIEVATASIAPLKQRVTYLASSAGNDSTDRPVRWSSVESLEETLRDGVSLGGVLFGAAAWRTLQEAASTFDCEGGAPTAAHVAALLAASGVEIQRASALDAGPLAEIFADAPMVELLYVPERSGGDGYIYPLRDCAVSMDATLSEVFALTEKSPEAAALLWLSGRLELPEDDSEDTDELLALDQEAMAAQAKHGGPFRIEIANRGELEDWIEAHMPRGPVVIGDRGPQA